MVLPDCFDILFHFNMNLIVQRLYLSCWRCVCGLWTDTILCMLSETTSLQCLVRHPPIRAKCEQVWAIVWTLWRSCFAPLLQFFCFFYSTFQMFHPTILLLIGLFTIAFLSSSTSILFSLLHDDIIFPFRLESFHFGKKSTSLSFPLWQKAY